MKRNKFIKNLSTGFILISGASFLYVSLLALYSPQSVMDLVQVQLSNNDAISSIRGVYGGVGLSIFLSLMFLLKQKIEWALVLLGLLWGFYALSRLITILNDGALGDFGRQWLIIESSFCLIAIILYRFQTKRAESAFKI